MARRSVRLAVRMECGDLLPAVDLSVGYLARFGSSNGFQREQSRKDVRHFGLGIFVGRLATDKWDMLEV